MQISCLGQTETKGGTNFADRAVKSKIKTKGLESITNTDQLKRQRHII